MELEGLNAPFDEEDCKRYSGWILSAIKNQKSSRRELITPSYSIWFH